eukprot:scaffold6285_cov121-Isochrysis_galbana.AAC.19
MSSLAPPIARQTCSMTWGSASKLTPSSAAATTAGAGDAGRARSSGRSMGCSSSSGMDSRLVGCRCKQRCSTSTMYGFLVGGKAMGLVASGMALSFW